MVDRQRARSSSRISPPQDSTKGPSKVARSGARMAPRERDLEAVACARLRARSRGQVRRPAPSAGASANSSKNRMAPTLRIAATIDEARGGAPAPKPAGRPGTVASRGTIAVLEPASRHRPGQAGQRGSLARDGRLKLQPALPVVVLQGGRIDPPQRAVVLAQLPPVVGQDGLQLGALVRRPQTPGLPPTHVQVQPAQVLALGERLQQPGVAGLLGLSRFSALCPRTAQSRPGSPATSRRGVGGAARRGTDPRRPGRPDCAATRWRRAPPGLGGAARMPAARQRAASAGEAGRADPEDPDLDPAHRKTPLASRTGACPISSVRLLDRMGSARGGRQPLQRGNAQRQVPLARREGVQPAGSDGGRQRAAPVRLGSAVEEVAGVDDQRGVAPRRGRARWRSRGEPGHPAAARSRTAPHDLGGSTNRAAPGRFPGAGAAVDRRRRRPAPERRVRRLAPPVSSRRRLRQAASRPAAAAAGLIPYAFCDPSRPTSPLAAAIILSARFPTNATHGRRKQTSHRLKTPKNRRRSCPRGPTSRPPRPNRSTSTRSSPPPRGRRAGAAARSRPAIPDRGPPVRAAVRGGGAGAGPRRSRAGRHGGGAQAGRPQPAAGHHASRTSTAAPGRTSWTCSRRGASA